MSNNVQKRSNGDGKFGNHQFKKSLGQNFISDKNLLEAITNDAEVDGESVVIEIGAGAGTLTEMLAQKAKRVMSFEIDDSLQENLKNIESQHENLKFIFQDFLKCDLQSVFEEICTDDEKVCVVANIPYYITTPIVFKLLHFAQKLKSITVMVQKEVGERMVAVVGNEDYGALSSTIAHYGKAGIKRIVKKQNFYPMPKVDSCIVKIDLYENINFDDKFNKLIQVAFSNRRKTLANNLMQGYSLDRKSVEDILQKCEINLNVRAEELANKQFEELAKFFQ